MLSVSKIIILPFVEVLDLYFDELQFLVKNAQSYILDFRNPETYQIDILWDFKVEWQENSRKELKTDKPNLLIIL